MNYVLVLCVLIKSLERLVQTTTRHYVTMWNMFV